MPKIAKPTKLRREARRLAASGPLPSLSLKEQKSLQEPDSDEVNQGSDSVGPQQPLSRGQRKRQAKRDAYLKKEQMILSSLRLKAQDEQKKRIDGLDAIREALLNTVTTQDGEMDNQNMKPTHATTNKAKQRLLVREVEHLNLVLQHPAFQADPFATMEEHLRNTLASQRKIQEAQAEKRDKEELKKEEEKKRLKKEHLEGKKKSRKKFKAGRSKAK